MDAIFTLFAIVALLALLGSAATSFGIDTREGFGPDAALRTSDAAPRALR